MKFGKLLTGKYGTKIHVWNWTTHELFDTLELGPDGLMPLEVRFLHNPNSVHGFVGCAIGGKIFHFYLDETSKKWKVESKISIPVKKVAGWALDQMPGLENF